MIPSLVFFLFLAVPGVAGAVDLPPGGTFADDDGTVHEGAIEALVASGVTNGCSVAPAHFCPDEPVTREAMAAFLYRALALGVPEASNLFSDDDESMFQTEINALAVAGIATGCGQALFCPRANVTRAEMASFLVRAFVGAGEFDAVADAFSDDTGSVHEADINRIASIGITRGCAEGSFCPHDPVTRGEMASFLTRAMGLTPLVPPARPPAGPLAGFTTYFACCEARVANIQMMAAELNGLVVAPGEVFSMNDRLRPRTRENGYVAAGILLNGEGYCCDHPLNVGGGTSQVATTLYNAVFRNGFEIISHRPHSRYFDRYPLGIEATLGTSTPDVVFRNDTHTPLTIVASTTGTSVTVSLRGDVLGRTTSWLVEGAASYSAGGSVRVLRSVQEADGEVRHQSWDWTYQGS